MTVTVTLRSFGVYHTATGKTASAAIHKALGRNVNPIPLSELTDRQIRAFAPWWGKSDRDQYGETPWGAAVNTVYGGEVRAIIAAITEEPVSVAARDLRRGDTIRDSFAAGEEVRWVIATPGQYVTVGFDSGIRHLRPERKVEVTR
jgi:hypothetical protein